MKSPSGVEPSEPECGSSPSIVAAIGGRARRVVLAEDDADLRAFLDGALRREGFVVTTVRDGVELVHAMRSLQAASDLPDLVVSDVQMPRCSGLVALGELRRAGIRLPVLLITAFGDDDTHGAAIRLGAAIIDKPFDIYKFRTIAAALVR